VGQAFEDLRLLQAGICLHACFIDLPGFRAIWYKFFWTSTTHQAGPVPASNAAYVSFGRAMGQMRKRILDVQGADAQRSDPKTSRPVIGHGPQGGDVRRLDGTMMAGSPPGEFGGPAHHFNMFDKNHDGFLSREEAPTGPPPKRMQHLSVTQ